MALFGKVISICVWSGDAGHVLVIVVILAFSREPQISVPNSYNKLLVGNRFSRDFFPNSGFIGLSLVFQPGPHNL